jgi:hypothetical protein
MTSSRLILAFLVTVAVGLIVLKFRSRSILKPGIADDRQFEKEEQAEGHDHDQSHTSDSHDHNHDDNSPQPDRLVLAMRTTMRDFTDTAMYFTIGVAITSVFKAYVTEDLILLFNQNEVTGIGLMMVLAFVLSLCSTSDAFIAANFPVPQSAKLAFLVFGPMMDVKLVFMYLSVFKSRFVITLAIGLFFVIGILSYLWFKI